MCKEKMSQKSRDPPTGILRKTPPLSAKPTLPQGPEGEPVIKKAKGGS